MSTDTQYSTIVTERIGMVERITMNRPEKRKRALAATAGGTGRRGAGRRTFDEVRCVIIRGAGPSFCAGYDLTPRSPNAYPGPTTVEQDVSNMIDIGDRWAKVWNCRIPVIAQIHG